MFLDFRTLRRVAGLVKDELNSASSNSTRGSMNEVATAERAGLQLAGFARDGSLEIYVDA